MRNITLCLFTLVGLCASLASMAEEISLFNGKDTTGWKLRNADRKDTWIVVGDVKLDPADPKKLAGSGAGAEGKGILFRQPVEHGSDLITEKTFGDCELHVELMIPKGANSGIYLMGKYEVQVLDSFGKADDKIGAGDMCAIYNQVKPLKNASKPAGEWQTVDIVFETPRFDAAGKKTSNAKFVSVKLNGVEVQKNAEATGPTGSQLSNKEELTGPIFLQGDHGIIAVRNVVVKTK